MDLVRDVLDKQLKDRRGRNMGKIDGIVVEMRGDRPPRVVGIELGSIVLARRLGPRVTGWVRRLRRKWGPKSDETYRIPWSKVKDVGIDVDVDLDGEKTPALAGEEWLRKHVIEHIPGA
jgi:sporulation protein YlmC with PRC-barrel domain